ncbi:MAG: iron-sulfur cluster assembly scaffold protein [Gammaproteobacteria bacterium]
MNLGELARDHLEHPRNTGLWPESGAALPRVAGEAGSAASGAFVRFRFALDDGRIMVVRYEVLGDPALMATASWLSDYLLGKDAEPAAVPAGLEIARTLELRRAEHGLALLAEDAARRALERPQTVYKA